MQSKLTIYVCFLIWQVFIFSLYLKVPRHSGKRHLPYMSVMVILFCNVSFLFHLMLFNFTLFYFNVTLSSILMCFCHTKYNIKERHSAEYHSYLCHYTECRGAELKLKNVPLISQKGQKKIIFMLYSKSLQGLLCFVCFHSFITYRQHLQCS